jgi:hypothetical protein
MTSLRVFTFTPDWGLPSAGPFAGDSEFIIELLSKRYGVDLDAGLSSEQKAIGLAWRRTFEEHFHQVLEWELFEHPAGAAYMRERMRSAMPPFSRCCAPTCASSFMLVGLGGIPLKSLRPRAGQLETSIGVHLGRYYSELPINSLSH